MQLTFRRRKGVAYIEGCIIILMISTKIQFAASRSATRRKEEEGEMPLISGSLVARSWTEQLCWVRLSGNFLFLLMKGVVVYWYWYFF